MKTTKFLYIALVFISVLSCTKTKPEPDNIFRFKEYIAFNTFGEVSIASPIRVVLAQPTDHKRSPEALVLGVLAAVGIASLGLLVASL